MHDSQINGLMLIIIFFVFFDHVDLWFVQKVEVCLLHTSPHTHPASPSMHLLKTLLECVEVLP